LKGGGFYLIEIREEQYWNNRIEKAQTFIKKEE